ncbi:signal peptidase I [Caulobacter sp. AP07]|uniref:signal peptidase I n=1 Tax=Caulobacter sp. AP07 TaxID=1144304 RepID=UPI0002721B04|nr:signal peptidase I [Caulobacter sp. AP07]EJL33351.1 signal peptidase I [Caulobacter sp. AP07]
MTEAVLSSPGVAEVVAKRPSRRGVAGAFVLNLLLPPVGYVFVGRVRLALAFLVLLIVAALVAIGWTFESPPGIYRWADDASNVGPIWILNVLAAFHAGWIAWRARATGAAVKRPKFLVHLLFAMTPLLIGLGLRAYLPLSAYTIPSASMKPSLTQGDVLGVYGARGLCGSIRPAVGDVIIHRTGRVRYVKRIVAGAGQVVVLRAGVLTVDGHVAVRRAEGRSLPIADDGYSSSGQVYRETLPGGRSYETLDLAPNGELDNFGPFSVPAGAWFALGDNRDNSLDSRTNGPVAQKDICGVVTKVLKSTVAARVGMKP